jgi:nitrite reductase (NADH) small subunit
MGIGDRLKGLAARAEERLPRGGKIADDGPRTGLPGGAVEFPAGPIEAIKPEKGRTLRAGPHVVAVFRLADGSVRATQPYCSHASGPLSDGPVHGTRVVCPLHGRTFDLDTGEAGGGNLGVCTFPARVARDGTIYVALPHAPPLPALSDKAAAARAAAADRPG